MSADRAVDILLHLSPAEFIDSDAPTIVANATQAAGSLSSAVDRARLLFAAVRDGIRYDPYVDYTKSEAVEVARP